MLLVAAALLSSSLNLDPKAMDHAPGVVTETPIGGFPPSPVEQPATDEVLEVCTINFLEEVDQKKTGQEPQQIAIYAEANKLDQKHTQQIREYCEAYSAGAAFVIASVALDATITDILARSRIPIIPTKGKHSK